MYFIGKKIILIFVINIHTSLIATRSAATIITPPITLEPSKTNLLVFVSKEIWVQRVDSVFISTDLFILSNAVEKNPPKTHILNKIVCINEKMESTIINTSKFNRYNTSTKYEFLNFFFFEKGPLGFRKNKITVCFRRCLERRACCGGVQALFCMIVPNEIRRASAFVQNLVWTTHISLAGFTWLIMAVYPVRTIAHTGTL